MPSRWRSRTSAPTPASRSPSGRRAAPCSSRPRRAGLECTEYAPARVKQSVCGYGRADKEQVGRMVKAILGLARGAAPEPRRRRARGRDLPRARAAAREGWSAVIARLRGKPSARTADGLVLDVGGVGYLVAATPRVRARVGEETTVETYLHVREDALQLYGFADGRRARAVRAAARRERRRAEGRARDRLRARPPDELRRAIVLEDTARFEAIPGHRQQDGAADRARAEGEARPATAADARRPRAAARCSRATRSSSSAGRCSTPSARSPGSTRSCRSRSRCARR